MAQTATAFEVSQAFEHFGRLALDAPVTITEDGHKKLVLMSHAAYARLKQLDRKVLRIDQMTNEDRALVASAMPSPESEQFNHEIV